ncbi:MAG: hypothetical protein N2045_03080 [Fimbriimonadales bacterium]|nr:hypothetical protein [Armatimonadota bacterium]MCX7686942.1 hypothetical protein [Fimbriimonadales bacterium]GIV12297.1 MAG: hypothetical protein KatS3mg021_0579 [Fimbriimonadales bacterium]CUU09956.1 hypothetical protein GBSOP10_106228 [Armatimonadetes bacterium GBS]CUU36803.1 hypothetical protein GXSOP10_12914 [Armatimonadetes bacterium GXS]
MKLPGTPLCLTVLGGLLLFGQGAAQPVYLAPLQSLPEFETRPSTGWNLRTAIQARTNVVPLLQPEPQAGLLYGKTFAYYDQYRVAELYWTQEAWRFGYRYEVAERYAGNRAAAQLYLEASAGELNPATGGQVQVSMNRTALNRWWVDYMGRTPLPNAELRYQVGLSLGVMRRLQQGVLTGQKEGSVFHGDMRLDSTLGVPAEVRGGWFWTTHAELSLQTAQGWGLQVRGENLFSGVHVHRAQRIEARIVADQLEPDADGFLHTTPAVAGRVETVSLNRRVQPLWEITFWSLQPQPTLALTAQHHFDWRYSVGVFQRRHWLRLWLPQPAVEVGWRHGQFELVLLAEPRAPSQAQQLAIQVSQRW